jgi:glycosyltransferase involved in cell wall biosynthesis
MTEAAALLALPMHGEAKLRREGLRTRDGHVLDWISRLRPSLAVHVHSRAEPWPRVTLARRRGQELPGSWRCTSPQPLVLPPIRARRRWWVKARRYSPPWPQPLDGAIVWNPVERPPKAPGAPVLFDLLDDWLIHPMFHVLGEEVRRGYAQWLDLATAVTANSEGTLELAHRFGRSDAILLPNGCDPERFSTEHLPQAQFTVGYGGKISERLDAALIGDCARALPHVRFELAGPTLARGVRAELAGEPNVRFLGDIPYPDYPAVLRRWDLAWVPHRVGPGEVGGDAIKVYEYRAAGLPTVTTKIIGWERMPDGVMVCERGDVLAAVAELSGEGPGSLGRDRPAVRPEDTWRAKTEKILDLLRL